MSTEKKKPLTPMMQQYYEIRESLDKDTLILFRLGDFYEMFDTDAERGAKLLGITLTARHGMPMAGIPYHAAESYLAKVIKQGVKVAICEQVETPQAGKLVKRELTRIITPGTTLESTQIDERKNHYILAIAQEKKDIHAAWLDLTEGEMTICSQEKISNLLPIFFSIDPKEVLLIENQAISIDKEQDGIRDQWLSFLQSRSTTELPNFYFSVADGGQSVVRTMNLMNLDGFGISMESQGLGPAGALIHYATETLREPPKHLAKISDYHSDSSLLIDPATLRNLEIFQSANNTREGSLIHAMDRCTTAAGSRLLEEYLAAPTLDTQEINRRQTCVSEFITKSSFGMEIENKLKNIRDIKRILTRLQNKLRNPRELGGIRQTLEVLPEIKQTILSLHMPEISKLADAIYTFDELSNKLSSALQDELPGKIQDGGIIAPGFNEDLDYLLNLSKNNKQWLLELERTEQEATGIKNLKIKYNGSFGYFIEVSKSNLALVPDHYVRKQTMTNAERYFTPDLKEKEKEILGAEERSLALEEKLFHELVEEVLSYKDRLRETAQALAEIDLYLGWAKLANEWNYCCPQLDDSYELDIEEGRHPVVEQMIKGQESGLAGAHTFVPNDTYLSADQQQIALLTGPNMAGKSTYIRQVALITLMAQVGSWVPAKKCHLGFVDRIFSRVGASDELSRGNSTFMVEMNETANILNNATERSLIILDEIGRGTSTYDGLSIAWSVIEFIHGSGSLGARTLFATHYHELPQLAETYPRIKNFSVAVKEWNDEIIFVRKVIAGATDRSYGIQVARLAGLPPQVISRAQEILKNLESGSQDFTHNQTSPPHSVQEAPKKRAKKSSPTPLDQLELF